MLVDHLIMITIKFITCLQYNIYYNHRIMLLDYKYNPCLFLSLKFHSNEYIYIYIIVQKIRGHTSMVSSLMILIHQNKLHHQSWINRIKPR